MRPASRHLAALLLTGGLFLTGLGLGPDNQARSQPPPPPLEREKPPPYILRAMDHLKAARRDLEEAERTYGPGERRRAIMDMIDKTLQQLELVREERK